MNRDITVNLTSNHSPDLAIKTPVFGCHGNKLVSMEMCPMTFFYIPDPDLHAKFGAHQPINSEGVAGQTHTVTFLPL